MDSLEDEVQRNRLSGNDIGQDIPEGPSVPMEFKDFEKQF